MRVTGLAATEKFLPKVLSILAQQFVEGKRRTVEIFGNIRAKKYIFLLA
jgi:hypothetical protein